MLKSVIPQLLTSFQQMVEHAPAGIFETNLNGQCTYGNSAFRALFGLDNHSSLTNQLNAFFHPDDKAGVIKQWLHCVKQGHRFSYTFRVQLPEQDIQQITINAEPVFIDNELIAYIGCVEDVSELSHAQQLLKENQHRYKLAIKGSSAGIWDWNILDDSVYYSEKFTDLLGFDNLAFGTNWSSLTDQVHPDDIELFENQLQNHLDDPFEIFDIECRLITQKNNPHWFNIVGEAVRDQNGYPLRMVGSISDITDKKQSQHVIWQQANFDPLTALPNRNMFADRLKQEIIKSKRHGFKFALMFIDLDHFKEVNDTLGHDAGDHVLVEVAERLQLILRGSDTIARIGGDEFTALISQISEIENVEGIAQKLIQTIELPFYYQGESIFISASIGITLFPEHSDRMDELMKFADQAMYRSKDEGRKRFSYFTPEMQETANINRQLTQELRLAIVDHDFKVLYQPIMCLKTGEVHKAEALIRWHHPELGTISPAEFIPLAERCGAIIDIGNWIFSTAAKQVQHWQQTLDPDFQISINKSPAQFQNPDPSADSRWIDALTHLGLNKGICLEITEGLLLDDGSIIHQRLQKFQAAGFEISLDDFGTGYSSLSYLTKFDINFLKIDRAFVSDLENSLQNQALCEAIIVMSHKLGLKVIAEGVETSNQLNFLKLAECDYAQGYYISRPITAEEFERQLKSPTPFNLNQ
ncbi:sensor domain-containing protein [Pseudoalteromonas ulvae]|uniref:sensor domain-containing protein n=1 Tax=Pseudoalteromonas ulvae TaxID=107327 RepID=UPI001FD1069A|nr:bifunctional diguanylate cyclase/phosphodiesterase [Pseudoalteromonas ulvae]